MVIMWIVYIHIIKKSRQEMIQGFKPSDDVLRVKFSEYQCIQRYLKSLDDPSNSLNALLQQVIQNAGASSYMYILDMIYICLCIRWLYTYIYSVYIKYRIYNIYT